MTDDTRTYGDAFEAVNAYVQRLGHLDGVKPVQVGGYAGVCLVAVLKNLLFDAGLDAEVLLEGDVVRCRHGTELARPPHADLMRAKSGRPVNNPAVAAANTARRLDPVELCVECGDPIPEARARRHALTCDDDCADARAKSRQGRTELRSCEHCGNAVR